MASRLATFLFGGSLGFRVVVCPLEICLLVWPLVEHVASTHGVHSWDKVIRRGGSIGVWLGRFWGSVGGPGMRFLPGDLGSSMTSGVAGVGDLSAGLAIDGGGGSVIQFLVVFGIKPGK